MPKQDFNKGLETKGPHRQGEKGGKGGKVERDGRGSEKGSQKVGPFDKSDKQNVSGKDRNTSNN